MPLLAHLAELRKRIIICLVFTILGGIACYLFSDTLIDLLYAPFRGLEALKQNPAKFYVTTIFEGFVIKMKIAAMGGVIAAIPFYLFHALRFLFPGLNRREKKVIVWSLASGTLLAAFGLYYGYVYVIPFSIQMLTGSGFIPSIVGLLLNFEKNIMYVFQFILAFMVIFQTPLVLVILMALNLVKRKALLKSSRFVIVGIFIVAAVLTPPDFISQLCMALPLVLLYYLAILAAKIFGWGKD
jgi:sec-independent protein translocase protein TatC